MPAGPLRAIARCDSVVVDPHKHGLQPYGCGAVLFADPAVGRFYRHDSPYTYFTSDELHLGEVSLECSRPGAAAAALWMTLELLPLEADRGLGPILAASLRATRDWAARIAACEELELLLEPELDILTFFPVPWHPSVRGVDEASQRLLEAGMDAASEPVYLSVLAAGADRLIARRPGLARDAETARVLRSVLMKPEHELHVDWLHARVTELARQTAGA